MTAPNDRKTAQLMGFLKRQEALFEEMVDVEKIKEWFSFAHWHVLMGLQLNGGKVTQTTAKGFISDSKYKSFSSDSKNRALIKQLVKAGLLNKSRDEDDERIVWIELTDRSKRQMERYFSGLEAEITKTAEAMK